MSNDIVDYEINVHVFGRTSSPSCSNYALRHTVTDNEDKFGKEATITLEKNFMLMTCLNPSIQSRMQHQ